MREIPYGLVKALPRTPFDATVQKVTEALKAEGFGVLTTIDVQGTLKQKLGADFRRYVILGACNPHLAHRALEAEPHVGLLLPCNVVVQERVAGGSIVSVQDPEAMFAVVGKTGLEAVAEDAGARLRRVLESL